MLLGTSTAKLWEEINIADENSFPPVRKVETGERLIGQCTPTMKKLYGLMVAYDQLSDQARLEIKHASQVGDDLRQRSANNQYLQTVARYQIYQKLFWFEVTDHFSVWDGTNTGIREGWKIVATVENSAIEALRDALGLP